MLKSHEQQTLCVILAHALIVCAVFICCTEGVSPFTQKPIPAFGISLNESTAYELSQLPALGYLTAQKVVEYREQNGAFKEANDLLKVKGIGPKTYEKIRIYFE